MTLFQHNARLFSAAQMDKANTSLVKHYFQLFLDVKCTYASAWKVQNINVFEYKREHICTHISLCLSLALYLYLYLSLSHSLVHLSLPVSLALPLSLPTLARSISISISISLYNIYIYTHLSLSSLYLSLSLSASCLASSTQYMSLFLDLFLDPFVSLSQSMYISLRTCFFTHLSTFSIHLFYVCLPACLPVFAPSPCWASYVLSHWISLQSNEVKFVVKFRQAMILGGVCCGASCGAFCCDFSIME